MFACGTNGGVRDSKNLFTSTPTFTFLVAPTEKGDHLYVALTNKHEFGTALFVDSKVNHLVTNFAPINERLCILRIKSRFSNYSLINRVCVANDGSKKLSLLIFSLLLITTQ
jgi:hypothetical protein